MPIEDELRTRWQQVLPSQPELGEELITRYGEPHRRYHNQDHLLAVLEAIDRFATSDHDLYLVRLAAWFHDAVYDIPERELTNEEASARLVVRRLQRAGLETEDINQVARLVRLTTIHQVGPGDADGELLCDADLAVLGGTPEEYARYVDAVREEYAAVDDEQFWAGRLDVLDGLAATQLFRTGRGRKLLKQARANLDAERAELRQRLGLPDPDDA
ncbi:HD domain-containing protein [Microlunatus parietis]|uniref:Putative metal-dependent HD superfamily phosphohydrolase n=1 Tax=Microlunatus parietis TaxID=682979 RepID=A0A7Y9I7C7_9ACTN|nr:HD domain-containing protein [Microlunatus parietis]NYE71643.1 putative metal-dependent HD superfamily phosphohydrolase [Microlunatus parietis]